MSKNPNWQFDELILALDLYFRLDNKQVDESNPEIIQLSRILNDLPIHNKSEETATFRNPNGVAMKLGNFKRFDPTYKGKGLERGGKLEEVVWDRYKDDKASLRLLANKIKEAVADQNINLSLDGMKTEEAEEMEANEGKVLYKLHKYYERDKKIIKKKKEQVLKQNGKLECEICGFNFQEKYGELGKGFIECHHTVPVAKMPKDYKTKHSDLALVCSNCHRMLHRKMDAIGIIELKSIRSAYQRFEHV
jgi:5-methylcytosine-specific restriction protein A